MATNDARGDMKAHTGTYTGFLSLLKKGAIITAIITVAVILIIAR